MFSLAVSAKVRKIHDPLVLFRLVFMKLEKPLDRPVVAGIQRAVAASPLEGHLPRHVFFKNYKTDFIVPYYNRRGRIKKVPAYSGKPGKMTGEVHETFLVLSGALC